MLVGFIQGQYAYATKIARLDIDELQKEASIVATVRILATEVTNEHYHPVHADVEVNLIRHQAVILDSFKGQTNDKEISFLSEKGLISGQKYLIFLSNIPGGLRVSHSGYGALVISVVSMKSGVVEGVRIPESYISLPKNFFVETGHTAKNEQASFVWITSKKLLRYLHRRE